MNRSIPFCFETVRDEVAMLGHLNQAIGWISSDLEHRFWCSREFPHGQALASFDGIAKPLEVYLIKLGEHAVGYFELHHNHHGWVLARHLVKPEFRGQGLATQLMDYSIRQLFQYSDAATLFRDEENTIAARLHDNFGFQEVGRFSLDKLICLRLDRASYLMTRAHPSPAINIAKRA